MPWTATAFLVAALSLAGIWPFSGFWSKDDVLAQAWDERRLVFYLAMATVPLTAFYIFRVYYLVFGGQYRGREYHLHESPPVMVIPMMVLSVAAIFSGWLNLDWGLLFAVLSVLTMTVGNVMALPQTNIKRLLAYSSIAHAGYILMGLAVVGVAPSADILGWNSVLFYLAAYGLMTMGAFVAIIAISYRLNSDMIDDYAGMARRNPWLATHCRLCG